MSTPTRPQTTERPRLVILVSPRGRQRRCSLTADEIAELQRLGWVIREPAGLGRYPGRMLTWR